MGLVDPDTVAAVEVKLTGDPLRSPWTLDAARFIESPMQALDLSGYVRPMEVAQ